MKSYGKLFGKITLIKDTHHDEVFIKDNGLIIIRNNIWLYDETELIDIAYKLKYTGIVEYLYKQEIKPTKTPENKFHLLMWGLI